jgi:transposase
MIKPYKPNQHNLESLKRWFNNFSFLTNKDLASMAGKSISTICRWKRRVEGKRVYYRKDFKNERLSEIDEAVWNCKSWFDKAYNEDELTVRQIAKKIGRSLTGTQNKLKKFGIERRSHEEAVKSNNKYCSEKWLNKHYHIEKLTILECADIAGVVPRTIMGWLVKFGIPIRESGMSQSLKWDRYAE